MKPTALTEAIRLLRGLKAIVDATPREVFAKWSMGAERPYELVREAELFIFTAGGEETPTRAELAEALRSIKTHFLDGYSVVLPAQKTVIEEVRTLVSKLGETP